VCWKALQGVKSAVRFYEGRVRMLGGAVTLIKGTLFI